jgi:hypothetical protein
MKAKYHFSPLCYFSFYKVITASEVACFTKVYHLCNFRAFVLFPPIKLVEIMFKENGNNSILHSRLREPGSVVGIATGYGLDGLGIESR